MAYATGVPTYAKLATNFEKIAIPVGIPDPTWGLSSATNEKSGVRLNQTLLDGLTDTIAARRPLSEYDGIVKDWQSKGGDQIRMELQQALAAGG